MGTGAFFQGYPIAALELNRARGLESTPSWVEIYVPEWDTLNLEPPKPGDTATSPVRGEDESLALDAARGRVGNRTGVSPGRVRWSGWVALCEIDTNGKQWGPFLLGPFYVVRAVSVKRSNTGRITRVRLILADSRFFWAQGGLTRWSYNRLRPDGTSSRDSERPGGGPWSPADVLRDVAARLHGVTSVARTPAKLDQPAGGVELEPGAPARDGIRALILRFGLADICLQWDNRVAFYLRGEGRVGHALDGRGENAQPLDPPFLDKGGTGYGREVEFGYPPDYVRVFGGLRIASVAIDRWEPVLHLPRALTLTDAEEAEDGPGAGRGGRAFFPLTEELLKRLVPGDAPPGGHPTWLEWLSVWILGPKSYHGIPGLKRNVAELLAAQAYRMFRLRLVVDENDGAGPNAHLLPLLERADLSGGRRLPVTVETFTFKPITWTFHGEASANKQRIRDALDALRSEILTAELRAPAGFEIGNPLELAGPEVAAGARPLSVSELMFLLGDDIDPLMWDGFAAAAREARYIERARVTAGAAAGAYESKLKELYALEGGYRTAVLEFAQEVAALEADLRAGRTSSIEGIRSELEDRPDLVRNLRVKARATSTRALTLRRQAALSARTGVDGSVRQPRAATFYENLARESDPGATVYDAKAGVVLTSRLAGWLLNPAVAVAHATHFVPKPVRVIFGTTMRPRVDIHPGAIPSVDRLGRRVETGTVPGDGGSGDQTREVLSDGETYYVSTFRRTLAGPVHIGIADTVASLALTIHHPELCELLGLDGGGNRNELDRRAADIAREAMDRPPVIAERRITLPHIWLVQCDGLVSGVRIRMRPRAAGFETLLEVGAQRSSFASMETRERRKPPARGDNDAAWREGLLP